MTSSTAFRTFSLANDVLEISPQDEIYKFDVEANKRIISEAPWTKELSSGAAFVLVADDSCSYRSPHYFKTCRISAVALIKMVRAICHPWCA
jgi:COP9 signalosome complex subunit 5